MADIRALLVSFGGENDQAYQRVMEFFAESPGRRVNSTELSLMGFKRWKAGQRTWVTFSPSCIERKARKLAEWGLLERGYDTSHHAWYQWRDGLSIKSEPKVRVEIIEQQGRMVAKYVSV